MSSRTTLDAPPQAGERETQAVAFDPARVRDDFPALQQKVHGKPLVYLDNAATTQKPRAVLDALNRYYALDNANVHRGVHELSERATRAYEEARAKVQRFLNAAAPREIIFVRGTTEAINLVAQSYGRSKLRPGDEIIISHLEHHSNIVPWQLVCEQTGAVLRVVPINDRGELLLDEYARLLGSRTRLVAVAHVSNALGTVNPVREIIELARRHNVPVLLDGAQAVPHLRVDVQELDCDFYAFSGHKVYGPTGIGVLYGKAELLEAMPPWQGGGDMISSVTFAKTTYNVLPYKFEAGTPHIAGVVGLGAALDYVEEVGRDAVAAHERGLVDYAVERLSAIRGVRLIGTAAERASVVSFVVDDPPLSALDVGTRLDLEGVAVRTGHHCCQPVMDRYGIPGTARASFAMYNTAEDVDTLASVLEKVVAEAARVSRSLPSLEGRPSGAASDRETQATTVFPPAAAGSPQAASDELADVFDFLDDWSQRYHYLIELGKKLLPMPAEWKTDGTRVRGCQSTVHLQLRRKPGSADVVEFLADSDADVVRGLIAVLQKVFSGHRAADVLAFDVQGFFHRLGLDNNLTLGRRNGLAAMVQRIQGLAAAVDKGQT
jgi:cysteine desulfurase/selenocysteine lyase